MRSDLIFGALTHVTNRYELCQLASKATRKLHKPNTRLQDTTNEVLDRFKDTIPKDEAAAPRPQCRPSGTPRGLARAAPLGGAAKFTGRQRRTSPSAIEKSRPPTSPHYIILSIP